MIAILCVLAVSCSDEESTRGEPPASETAATTTEPAPTGNIYADLRQSSRDAALGRIEVWIGNDTAEDITPTVISYSDPRFKTSLPGDRLRLNPSQSERGYPLYLPSQPACETNSGTGIIEMTYDDDRTVTLEVTDDNDVVQRYVDSRCLELAVADAVDLHWAEQVPVDKPGKGGIGTFILVVEPTGVPGHVLTIDTVGGTPLFSAAGQDAWAPDARIRSDGAPQRIELPTQPARCDDHVFMESAGATAFLVGIHLDGEAGQLIIRMNPAGASAAIAYARDSCGLGS